jgi:hypothetical protein
MKAHASCDTAKGAQAFQSGNQVTVTPINSPAARMDIHPQAECVVPTRAREFGPCCGCGCNSCTELQQHMRSRLL